MNDEEDNSNWRSGGFYDNSNSDNAPYRGGNRGGNSYSGNRGNRGGGQSSYNDRNNNYQQKDSGFQRGG